MVWSSPVSVVGNVELYGAQPVSTRARLHVPKSPDLRIVDVLVHRLRKKVDADYEPKLIETVRGVGYVLRVPADSRGQVLS